MTGLLAAGPVTCSLAVLGVGVALDDLTLSIALAAGIMVWSAARFFLQSRLPGRPLSLDDEPDLAVLIGQVAVQVDVQVPFAVRIVPTPEAALYPAVRRGQPSTLVLGWPLLRTLTAAQLTSVVAHEIAHHRPFTNRRDLALIAVRGAVVGLLDSRFPRRATALALLRATQPRRWELETAADAHAAHVAGTAATRAALTQVAVTASVFYHFGEHWARALAAREQFPADLYDALHTAMADPHVVRQALAALGERGAADPWPAADHPPLRSRIAALPDVPTPPGPRTRIVAGRPVPIHQHGSLNRWAAREVLTTRAARHAPHPAHVLDCPPELFDTPFQAAQAELMALTGRATPADAIAVALDRLTSDRTIAMAGGRRWPGRTPDPAGSVTASMPWTVPSRSALTDPLSAVISKALLDAGWSRASRWTSTVVTCPQGRTIDIRELIEQAVATGDTAAVRALHTRGAATAL
ncbi:hypothetical protein CcI49_28205 [Frankia sp. CcI49]|nr:hypothetical protein CcI49_28205 [Frankia sp. CcI49]